MYFMGFNLLVIAAIVLVMVALRWRKVGALTWSIAWWLAIYLGIKFGFEVAVPRSVMTIYMTITTASIAAYVSSSRERWANFTDPILRTILDKSRRLVLLATVLLIPTVVAAAMYGRLSEPLQAPAFGRTVHPSPPTEITVHEASIDLIAGDNPYRGLATSSPEEFAQHVENGRRVYFENCFYCHGDAMAGDGMFAHGLNPIPTNFTDQGVLPMLQESFLFWRIAKGAPGMPAEGGPWDSAMPAWEKFLTEEEMWDVVLFLYDYTGYEPRSGEAH